jgi:hypothetical protein
MAGKAYAVRWEGAGVTPIGGVLGWVGLGWAGLRLVGPEGKGGVKWSGVYWIGLEMQDRRMK